MRAWKNSFGYQSHCVIASPVLPGVAISALILKFCHQGAGGFGKLPYKYS